RPLDAAAAEALGADAQGLDGAADLALHALEVGLELAPADARDLTADAAQVLGLAAARDLIAQRRLLAADATLHAHGQGPRRRSRGKTFIITTPTRLARRRCRGRTRRRPGPARRSRAAPARRRSSPPRRRRPASAPPRRPPAVGRR